MRAFGQELNPESYAICKADLLIKGQEVSNIKLGNTLSGDQLYSNRFDYMLSNPPFGVDWKKIEGDKHGKPYACKIFDYYQFGYRRITVERPLRESYQFSDDRIAELRFATGALNAPMKWVYEKYGSDWGDVSINSMSTSPQPPRRGGDSAEFPLQKGDRGISSTPSEYGDLSEHTDVIRAYVKKHFEKLKEKQIKDLLNPTTWTAQLAVLQKARAIQEKVGTKQCNDMNGFDAALKKAGGKLDAGEKKQIQNAVSWKNPDGEKVIKKVHRGAKANPLYGLFEVNGKVVEYQPDSDLRDNENVPLNPKRSVNKLNEEYFKREVLPHVPEAWIDSSKVDTRDGEVGQVGYEIPFNRHFYVYKPPRPLEEIDADLDKVSAEIMALLREVHS